MDPVPAPEAAPVVNAAPVKSGGPSTRLWIIVGAVIVLAAVIGVVVYFVLTSQAIPSPVPASVTAPSVPAATAQEAAEATAGESLETTTGTQAPGASTITSSTPTIPDVTNADIFEPRDPFVVIAPPTVATSTASTSETSLSLTDIVTQDGVRKAVVSYKGNSYTVGAGDTIDSSSYKVLTVYAGSVKFQFGDSVFTLALGQGTSK
jgi:cytoskeletal protein RodZ